MAITAALTLTSGADDLVSDALSLSVTTALTKAGGSTAIASTSGLARKTTVSTDQYTLYRADDYATVTNANKVYLKNTETASPALYFTVTIDDEPMGRLYGGDWAFFPWLATNGVPATFTAAPTLSWGDATDQIVFDGVTVVLGGSGSAAMVDAMVATKYPNWTCTEHDSVTALYTAKDSNILYQIEEGTTADQFVVTTAGSGVITTARVTAAVASGNDIKITPSTTGSHTLESMLFYE